METDAQLIDFKELATSDVRGEGLEKLVRLIGQEMGLTPIWSGRGADEGRDLLFTEISQGPISQSKITWLVSCKDKAQSGQSVKETDLPYGILEKVRQHKANGFLLATTTTISTGAKALLDAQDKEHGGEIHTKVWDSAELISFLLKPSNLQLVKQFLPKSYERIQGLTTLGGALLAFRDQLPETIFNEVLRLVKPYSVSLLKGTILWPYDATSAEAIDKVIEHLIIKHDLNSAVESTKMELGAFATFINRLHEEYEEECHDYLFKVLIHHTETDIRFNAAHKLIDGYELDDHELFKIATHAVELSNDAIVDLFDSQINDFIVRELFDNPLNYEIGRFIDGLSSETRLDGVFVNDMNFDIDVEKAAFHRLDFFGHMDIHVALMFDGKETGYRSLFCSYTGYFDKDGWFLEEARDADAGYEELSEEEYSG